MPLVETEFIKIKDIWENESKKIDEDFTGFRNCHVRSSIGEPGLSISLNDLQALLGTSNVGSLKVNDSFISNGFSLRTVNTTVYGTINDDCIILLSVHKSNDRSFEEFGGIVTKFDVIFVNCCRTQLID